MKTLGIVAALPGELAPLVAGWERRGEVYVGTLTPDALPSSTLTDPAAPITVYATAAGMGAAAATRAFSLLTSAASEHGQPLDAVLSFGWAGAITCGVKPPEVYTLSEVIDSRTGEHFPTASPPPAQGAPLRLVTIDHVARASEKRPLAERYRAVLVDMEAATVARLARAHQLDFYCVKGISDAYTDVLPDFNRFLDGSSQLRLPALVAHALLRPHTWRPLARLGTQSRAAARNLAVQLPARLQSSTRAERPSETSILRGQ